MWCFNVLMTSIVTSMEKYTPPADHPTPVDYVEFYKSMTDDDKELMIMAKEKLGSSYFAGWTQLYKKWKSGQK